MKYFSKIFLLNQMRRMKASNLNEIMAAQDV